MNRSIKSVVACAAYYSGFLRLYQFLSNPGELMVSIFMYHRIQEGQERNRFSEYIVGPTPQAFERQIAYLCKRYHIISLDDFVEAVQSGKWLPRRYAVITFDDGYRDNYTLAYPILRKYNAPATIFLTTGHVGTNNLFWTDKLAYVVKNTVVSNLDMGDLGSYDLSSETKRLRAIFEIRKRLKMMPDEVKDSLVEKLVDALRVNMTPDLGSDLFLSWNDVRRMHANGVSFGAHTVTHPLLTKVAKERALAEIVTSKKRIEEELGEPVRSFSYPGGRFDEDIKMMVREEGFTCAVTTRSGTSNLNSDLYELGRIDVEEEPFYKFAFDATGIITRLKTSFAR